MATKVREYFMQNLRVPRSRRVLCFFAGDDALRWGFSENRGRYYEQIELEKQPEKIRIVATPLSVDSLIVIFESAWKSDLGATMTFAHELQHFLQSSNEPKLWTMDRLLQWLPKEAYDDLKHGWKTPCDTEARVVAKRVALALHVFDKDSVDKYIAERIQNAAGSPGEKENWESVRSIDPSTYSLAKETRSLIHRYKPRLKRIQQLTELAQLPCATVDLDCDYWRAESK